MNMSEKRGNVWVFVEQEGGKIASVSLQLISKGRELADRLGVKLEAVFPGDNLEKAVPELFHYGCDKVFLAVTDAPENWKEITIEEAEQIKAEQERLATENTDSQTEQDL